MRYYYDTGKIFVVEEDGQLSAFCAVDMWTWVIKSGFNVLPYEYFGQQFPHEYSSMQLFFEEAADHKLIQRYIKEKCPATIDVTEIKTV